MRIPVDPQSMTPLYRQIEQFLRRQILSGALAAETRLPATRELAVELGVSRITVNNAYATLESEGLLYSREGSGTFVLARPASPARPAGDSGHWPAWQQTLARERADPHAVQRAPARPASRHRTPISFTGAGDPSEYPVKAVVHAMQEVIQRDGPAALEYGDLGQGYPPLRRTISHLLGSQGISAHPDSILITSGSQQALALVCQLLLRPGDVVLVENPTYNLALDLLRTLEARIVGVPVDGQGMVMEQVEPLLHEHRPRLIYTIPNFQNPTGVCLSGTRRRRLVALAGRCNIPILEDDYAGDLRYDGRTQPALKTLDAGGSVIYTGTFAKMLMPGLRVGFLVAEGQVLKRLVELKRVTDLTVSPLIQRTLEAYANVGLYQSHLRRSCRLYRKRRDILLAAIRRYLPAEVHVEPPHGGLFAWLRLPAGVSCLDLLEAGAETGVEFAPGTRFFAAPAEGEGYLRLNFAVQPPEEIDEGIKRLAAAMALL